MKNQTCIQVVQLLLVMEDLPKFQANKNFRTFQKSFHASKFAIHTCQLFVQGIHNLYYQPCFFQRCPPCCFFPSQAAATLFESVGKNENKQFLQGTNTSQIVVFSACVEHKYTPGIISKDILCYFSVISQRIILNKLVIIQNMYKVNNFSLDGSHVASFQTRCFVEKHVPKNENVEFLLRSKSRVYETTKISAARAGSSSGGFTTNGGFFTTIDGPAINLRRKIVQNDVGTLHYLGVYNCFTE